jgi:hypothetical protein
MASRRELGGLLDRRVFNPILILKASREEHGAADPKIAA